MSEMIAMLSGLGSLGKIRNFESPEMKAIEAKIAALSTPDLIEAYKRAQSDSNFIDPGTGFPSISIRRELYNRKVELPAPPSFADQFIAFMQTPTGIVAGVGAIALLVYTLKRRG